MTSRSFSMSTWTTRRSLGRKNMRNKTRRVREKMGRMEGVRQKSTRNHIHSSSISTLFAKITRFCYSLRSSHSLRFSQMNLFYFCFKCSRFRATLAFAWATIQWAQTASSTICISTCSTPKPFSMAPRPCFQLNRPTRPFSSSRI